MEKRKNRFNVVDVFVIIVAILLIAAFAYYAVGDSNGFKTDTFRESVIRYTVSIEGFGEEYKDLIKVGDPVKNIDLDCEMGKVVAVTPAEHTVIYNYNKTEGKLVAAQVPDSYKCTITVETECEEDELAYYVGELQIKTGKRINFKTPEYAFPGTVMGIERSDAQ
ncbi:MAG: DUF4330 domain-containing protein [Clostridia bacterium]|nr:DUF4330 domain-containing protein [Clostridia bacterium]